MLITIVTIFPEMFPGALAYSLAGKNLGKLWDLRTVDIREFAHDKHKKVDDTPYGGGNGMLMKPDVVHDAMKYALSFYANQPEILFMSPKGTPFSNQIANTLSKNPNGIIILCGRYEGIDQRVIDYWKANHDLKEISIGDYILFGGEIPAMVVIDSCLRFVPGMMGNSESVNDESFAIDLLEYPQYTKPAIWEKYNVPSVLLSGNHEEIASWRIAQSKQITQERRPDLWQRFCSRK